MWIPTHQFRFLKARCTIQKCHPLTDVINKALDDKHYCSAVFLDVGQDFDKVWHQDLLLKIKQTLFQCTLNYYSHTYKTENSWQLTTTKLSSHSRCCRGVPQGSILGPILYTINITDILQSNKTIISTLAHNTAIFTTHPDPTISSANLQDYLYIIEN